MMVRVIEEIGANGYMYIKFITQTTTHVKGNGCYSFQTQLVHRQPSKLL